MKKLLFSLALMLFAGMSFGQLKVVSNGFTGIGPSFTTGGQTPGAQLDVNGGVRLSAPGSVNSITGNTIDKRLVASCNINSSVSWSYFSMFGNEAFTGGSPARAGEISIAGQYILLRTNVDNTGFGQESVRITDTGNVGIGTNSPSQKLHVNGNIVASGTITPSDKRLKSGIKPFNKGLETVLQIKPVTYKYNGEAGIDSDLLHIGVVAQELQEIAPYLVGEYTHEERNIDNEVVKSAQYLNIQDSHIKYLLVNAIQEQQELIETQAEKIAELEAAVKSIRTNGIGSVNESEVTLTYTDLASLDQNIPNPFNGSTTIQYAVPSKAKSALMNIFDMNGKVLKTIQIQHLGEGQLTVNASDIPSGTYTYQLVVDGQIVTTKKMVLNK